MGELHTLHRELCGEVSTTLWQCEKEEAHLHGHHKQLEALRVQILCMSCKEKKKKTPSTPISKVKGEPTPACPITNVRGSQMQPENTVTFLCCVPACRQGLRTLTYTELWGDPCWGYSVAHRCSNLREDGAWTSLFSPTLLHSTAEPTNTEIFTARGNAILCLSALASDGQRERGK